VVKIEKVVNKAEMVVVTKTMAAAAAVDMDKTEDKRFNLLNLSLFFI
jgi:hypothetical protein